MKKALVVLMSMALATSAYAGNDPWDPNSKFSTDAFKTKNIQLSVTPVDDTNKTCNAENKKRGFPTYTFSVDACTFWSSDFKKCEIFVLKNVSMHTLGHELRHCLVGDFHR